MTILTQTPAARKPYAAPRPRDRAARLAHLIRRADRIREYHDKVGFSLAASRKAWHGAGSEQYRAAERCWMRMLRTDDRRVESLRRALAALEAPATAQDEPAGLGAGGLPEGPDDAERAWWAARNEGGVRMGEASPWDRTLGACESAWDRRNAEARAEGRLA
jgi:hypothetical protein